MSENHSQLSIGTMVLIKNPNTKRKIKVKVKKINTNGKIQVTRIKNYGNGSGGKHNFLINRNQILVNNENNSGNVDTTNMTADNDTDDGNFNDIVGLPGKGASPFISTMSFPKNEVLKEKFNEIRKKWYGDIDSAPLKPGLTLTEDDLFGKYRLSIPKNRMHIVHLMIVLFWKFIINIY